MKVVINPKYNFLTDFIYHLPGCFSRTVRLYTKDVISLKVRYTRISFDSQEV